MNYVERLLKADAKRADELAKGTFRSKKIAKIIGEEADAVDIEIREIPSRRLNDYITYQADSKGGVDMSKTYDAKLMICADGVVNPNLKDNGLQEHFGCQSATGLAEKLFGYEVNELSDAIMELSEAVGDADKKIKN